jgi:pyruvate dehydrogenase E1 component beta subunit
MRQLTYSQAINEALHISMERDTTVVQIGVGVNTPWFVGQTMKGLLERFGDTRMMDTPVSENGITGMAIGAAMAGIRPVLTFPRLDFMLLRDGPDI